jgi:hypothetical protein
MILYRHLSGIKLILIVISANELPVLEGKKDAHGFLFSGFSLSPVIIQERGVNLIAPTLIYINKCLAASLILFGVCCWKLTSSSNSESSNPENYTAADLTDLNNNISDYSYSAAYSTAGMMD